MHDTDTLLEVIKVRHAIQSDYRLAKVLGIPANRISNYRSGRSRPDDVTAKLIADKAGLDVGYVLACLHAERAQSTEARSIWEALATRLQAVALALAVMSAGFVASPDASAMARTPAAPAQTGVSLYIMSTRIRRWLAHLARVCQPLGSVQLA